jgi:hypothetical protein
VFVSANFANFLKFWLSYKNGSAVGSLRTLNVVAGTYAAAHGGGYPTSLADLEPPAIKTPDAQALRMKIDELASRWMYVFEFTYVPSDRDEKGIPKAYSIRADPVPVSGWRQTMFGSDTTNHYFTDQTGVIRMENDKPADKNSPPLPE